ncbi:methyltransferase [Sphingomonas sp. RT2P30]|uniref:class I SAM-dependent methyltransferase n=1 Tax=Parasphingomonas halimpatiens TaxID=3096162 RepID=UPI002FC97B77
MIRTGTAPGDAEEMPVRKAIVRATLAVGIVMGGGTALASGAAAPFAAILADPSRPEADRVRDADRKPAELIAFAKLRPGAQVAELAPGGGYFTRILSAWVGPRGHIYAMAGRPSPALNDIAASHANVSVVPVKPGEINVPAPVDMVWTTLNYHDFKNNKQGDVDGAALINAAAFKALKPGGIYLIVDHQAAPGAGATVTSTLHRIEDKVVRSEVEHAGFRFDGASDLLRHGADEHTLKVVETGIRGKTDQFILRFRKPR